MLFLESCDIDVSWLRKSGALPFSKWARRNPNSSPNINSGIVFIVFGRIKIWRHAMYPVYMAVYLDMLSPICRISLAMQQEIHDPVKVIKRIVDQGKIVILLE